MSIYLFVGGGETNEFGGNGVCTNGDDDGDDGGDEALQLCRIILSSESPVRCICGCVISSS